MKDYVVSENKRHELANYLKKIREEKSLGLNQFCLKANIQASQYSRLENGQLMKINPFLLQKIGSALNIDYKKLYKMIGYLDNCTSINNLKVTNSLENMIQVPIYDSLLDGVGKNLNSQPIDFLTLPKNKAKNSVIINIHNNCMEPTIQTDSSILVQLNVKINNNDIGIFLYENEVLVRRFRIIEDKKYLYSDNINYPPKEIRKSDNFYIYGKVIWIMNNG